MLFILIILNLSELKNIEIKIVMKKIAIACDHAGFEYKEIIKKHLEGKFIVEDFGTHSEDSVDYPDFVHPAATSIEEGRNEFGILICGSGNGVQMSANKHKGIRCALCWMPELAILARKHNNANMIALPARFIASQLATDIVDEFLAVQFEGGRHQGRVEKISAC